MTDKFHNPFKVSGEPPDEIDRALQKATGAMGSLMDGLYESRRRELRNERIWGWIIGIVIVGLFVMLVLGALGVIR